LQFYPDRNPASIHITGTPQFDFHVREEFRWSRELTLERLGLRPGDRYILYAAQGEEFTPTEPDLVEAFAQQCMKTPALRAHRIVVRPHPFDNYRRWDRLVAHNPDIVLNQPWDQSNIHNGGLWTKSYSLASPEDQARLVSTLLHADVCLNMWSSMSLDSAAVDTPVVCVAFAAQRGGLEERFYREAYNVEFYRPIAESAGVRLAFNMEQLVAGTVAYV